MQLLHDRGATLLIKPQPVFWIQATLSRPGIVAIHLAQPLQYIAAFVRKVRRCFRELSSSMRETVGQQNLHPREQLRNTGAEAQPETNDSPPPGHGRNGAEASCGSRKIAIAHPKLKHGDRCPECGRGNVYGQKDPKVLVRIVSESSSTPLVFSVLRGRTSIAASACNAS